MHSQGCAFSENENKQGERDKASWWGSVSSVGDGKDGNEEDGGGEEFGEEARD